MVGRSEFLATTTTRKCSPPFSELQTMYKIPILRYGKFYPNANLPNMQNISVYLRFYGSWIVIFLSKCKGNRLLSSDLDLNLTKLANRLSADLMLP